VPVVDAEGMPLGIVTEGDLIRRLADQPPGPFAWFLRHFADARPLAQRFARAHGATARDVMSTALVSVTEDGSVERVAQLMEAHAIRRVLVIRGGHLLGIISRADLLRAILRALPAQESAASDATILHATMAAMREQPWVDTFWVYPDVTAGVVTLYGFARHAEARQGLMALAQGVPGVKAVQDRLEPMPLILRATL